MKTLFKILVLFIIFCSCDEDDSIEVIDHSNDKLIEEYTYNPYGVVFKITNDINSVYDFEFDSLTFGKFHYDYPYDSLGTFLDDIHNIEHFTWIPYGHYVSWRYNYTGEKQIIIVTNINEDGAIIFGLMKKYSCDPSEIDTEWFQEIFPHPVNDTVYVSINKLIEDM